MTRQRLGHEFRHEIFRLSGPGKGERLIRHACHGLAVLFARHESPAQHSGDGRIGKWLQLIARVQRPGIGHLAVRPDGHPHQNPRLAGHDPVTQGISGGRRKQRTRTLIDLTQGQRAAGRRTRRRGNAGKPADGSDTAREGVAARLGGAG